ncbi:MAG: hypothetical protein SFY66_19665 [Oculatellaceae cyanobacterium bins.114]|nr:hypothetical protein [Oculatellaceae cyanobacterium bins.114]
MLLILTVWFGGSYRVVGGFRGAIAMFLRQAIAFRLLNPWLTSFRVRGG